MELKDERVGGGGVVVRGREGSGGRVGIGGAEEEGRGSSIEAIRVGMGGAGRR